MDTSNVMSTLEILGLANSRAVLFIALAVAPLFYATRRKRFDQLLGELSYPAYVTHILIAELMVRWTVPPALLAGNVLHIAIVIAASLLLLFGVTMPLNSFRRRFGARNIYPSRSSRAEAGGGRSQPMPADPMNTSLMPVALLRKKLSDAHRT